MKNSLRVASERAPPLLPPPSGSLPREAPLPSGSLPREAPFLRKPRVSCTAFAPAHTHSLVVARAPTQRTTASTRSSNFRPPTSPRYYNFVIIDV